MPAVLELQLQHKFLQKNDVASLPCIPDLDRPIFASRREPLSLAMKGHRRHISLMGFERCYLVFKYEHRTPWENT